MLKPPPVDARRVPMMLLLLRLACDVSSTLRLMLLVLRPPFEAVASERRRCTEEARKARCRCFFLALYDEGVRLSLAPP